MLTSHKYSHWLPPSPARCALRAELQRHPWAWLDAALWGDACGSQEQRRAACWEHPGQRCCTEAGCNHLSTLRVNFQPTYFLDSHYYRCWPVVTHREPWLYEEYPRRYPLSTSDICTRIFTTTNPSSRKGTPIKRIPIQRGYGLEEVHCGTLFDFRLHTPFTIKICCNRKSPYFEVSTGCGLKFPSESIDDCFSIMLT